MAEHPAFQLSIEALQGKWEHSSPSIGIITVRGDTVYSAGHVAFPDKLQDAPEGEIAMGKWVTVTKESSVSQIEWCCNSSPSKRCQWSFEAGLSDVEDDVNLDAVLKDATAPVEPSRRVRRRVVRPVPASRLTEITDLISQCEASELEKLGLQEAQHSSSCQAPAPSLSSSAPANAKAPPATNAEAAPPDAGTTNVAVVNMAKLQGAVAGSVEEAQAKLEKTEGKLSAPEVLKLLDFLSCQPIDAQMMAVTRIPQTVTAVRKSFAGHPEISKVGKELLSKWRLLFQQDEEERVRRSS